MKDYNKFISELKKLPDIYENFTTTSYQFKNDIFKYFKDNDYNCIELGCYQGYTSRILSFIFDNVLSLDFNDEFLQKANKYNKHIDNVGFINIDLSDNDKWNDKIKSEYQDKFQVAFIDGKHNYESCINDLNNTFELGCKYFILDDVAIYGEVKKAVDEFCDIHKENIESITPIGIDYNNYKLPVLNMAVEPFFLNGQVIGFNREEWAHWCLFDKVDIELNDGSNQKPMFKDMNIDMRVIRNYAKVLDFREIEKELDPGLFVHYFYDGYQDEKYVSDKLNVLPNWNFKEHIKNKESQFRISNHDFIAYNMMRIAKKYHFSNEGVIIKFKDKV